MVPEFTKTGLKAVCEGSMTLLSTGRLSYQRWGKKFSDFAARQIAYLSKEGRPILFLAGLCGLAGVLMLPVAAGLTLPFVIAGAGAVIVFGCLERATRIKPRE